MNLNSITSFLYRAIRNTVKQKLKIIQIKKILIMFQPPIPYDGLIMCFGFFLKTIVRLFCLFRYC